MENENSTFTPGVTETSLLRRVAVFLEDGDFKRADEYCEKVLDINVENGEAYLYKLLAKLGFAKKEQLYDLEESFDSEFLYGKIMRFASDELKKEVENINLSIIARNEERARLQRYEKALCDKETTSLSLLKLVCDIFRSLGEYKDCPEQLRQCIEKGESIYDEGYNFLFLKIKDIEQQISNIRYHISTDLAEKEGYDEYINENRGKKVFDYSKPLTALIIVIGLIVSVMLALPLFEHSISFTTAVRYLSTGTAPALLITVVAAFLSFRISKLLIKRQKSNLLTDITTAAQRARELSEEIRNNENEELFLKKELEESLTELRRLNEDYDAFTGENGKKNSEEPITV